MRRGVDPMNDLNVEEIIQRSYTLEVVYDRNEDTTGWFARVVEWPGCMTQADNFTELGEMIQDAMRAWAETCLEEGLEIPEPLIFEEPLSDHQNHGSAWQT
jgi:predicted RNase H-like HicB family nuclease